MNKKIFIFSIVLVFCISVVIAQVQLNDATNFDLNNTVQYNNQTNFELGDSSCAYSSGNWNLLCSDMCVLTTDYNLGGNNLSITGTGTTIISANITNFSNVWIRGTDTTNICTVTLNSGHRLG